MGKKEETSGSWIYQSHKVIQCEKEGKENIKGTDAQKGSVGKEEIPDKET